MLWHLRVLNLLPVLFILTSPYVLYKNKTRTYDVGHSGARFCHRERDGKMKQLVMDISSGMVLGGFVIMMTVWMMILGG